MTHQRPLTPTEIDEILQVLQPQCRYNQEIGNAIIDSQRHTLRKELESITLYPCKIKELKHEIERQFYQSQISPGESVGILAAQSIGERQTQLVLNSFHVAGKAITTVVTGVPRFLELMNATKNPKAPSAFIVPQTPVSSRYELYRQVGNQLQERQFHHFIIKVDVNPFTTYPFWYKPYSSLFNVDIPTTFTKCVRFTLSQEQLLKSQKTTVDIAHTLNEKIVDGCCIPSPMSQSCIDLLFSPDIVLLPDDTPMIHIHENNVIQVFVEKVLLPIVREVHICGIENIEDMAVVDDETTKQLIIQTKGSHLQDILTLPFVNKTKTFSNHMWEIYSLFGIEATRVFLVSEILHTISSDSYINSCHVELLVDIMLFTGTITSISRYGVHRNQSGPLTKSSFEESLEHFLNAGLFTDKEMVDGISAAIMCGKPSTIGTGMCDLLYDLHQ